MTNNSTPVEMSQRNESKECKQSHTITISEIYEAARKTRSKSSAFICRVPEELRKLKESAYTPRRVSIGPLHRDDKHLNPRMKDVKMSYVDDLFRRVDESDEGRSAVLSNCLDEMKKLKGKAREYYAEEVDALNEDMLVIDGCFILELLYRHHVNKNCKGTTDGSKESSNQTQKDSISGSSARTLVAVRHDLLLLENQLPFFVLEKLFSLTVDRIKDSSSRLSLRKYVLSYFPNFSISNSNAKNCPTPESCDTEEIKHILHLLHKHCLPPHPTEENGPTEFMYSASDLDYAGVKFVAGKGEDPFAVTFSEPRRLFRWFQRARFEIPNMRIHHSTEPFLRNLIAFEQCCPDFGCYVTSYAFLMDRLINTEKDVQVLEKAGVICNYLGAHDEASDLFNKLCKEVFLGDHFYFAETCKQAAAYSKRFWPSAMAHLRRNYLATPWTIIAFCAGFIVFCASLGNFLFNLSKQRR